MRAFTDSFPAIRPYLFAMCRRAAHALGLPHLLPATAQALSDALKLPSPHRLRALLRVLTWEGTLRCSDQGVFALARPADLSPDALNALPWVAAPPWSDIAQIILQNTPTRATNTHEHLYQQAMARASADIAARCARSLRARLRTHSAPVMLDIGGGLGAWVSAFLQEFPNGSAVIIERAEVAALARVEVGDFGGRVRWVVGEAGDFLRSNLGLFDWVVMSNVVHWYGEREVRQMLAAVKEVMRVRGWLMVKDFALEGAFGGGEAVYFGLSMALNAQEGDVYGVEEVSGWVQEAGFGGGEGGVEVEDVEGEGGVRLWWGVAVEGGGS